MATKHGSGETGKSEPENGDKPAIRDEDLERRRRQLDATLASRRRSGSEGNETPNQAERPGTVRRSSCPASSSLECWWVPDWDGCSTV